MSVAGGWTRKGGPALLHLFGLSLRPFVTRKLNVAPKDGHEGRRRRTVASPLAGPRVGRGVDAVDPTVTGRGIRRLFLKLIVKLGGK